MPNLAPRGRDPETLKTRLWHGTRESHRARVFALVVSFHNVLRLIRKLRVRGWTSGAKPLRIKRN